MCKNQENAYIFTGLAPKFIFTCYIVESYLIYQRYMKFRNSGFQCPLITKLPLLFLFGIIHVLWNVFTTAAKWKAQFTKGRQWNACRCFL